MCEKLVSERSEVRGSGKGDEDRAGGGEREERVQVLQGYSDDERGERGMRAREEEE